jgi:NADH dehydrogenase
MKSSSIIDVVVIGAGYAGAMATNRLIASLDDVERGRVRVRVVNPRPDFIERIRLHELAAGSRGSVASPLSEVLHAAATLVVGTATMIDPEARQVTVVTGGGDELVLRYDHLVYAPGSTAAASIPGARQHAFLLADTDDAHRAAAAIGTVREQRVLVVGGGLTGVETAGEIAEQHPDIQVTLVSAGQVLAGMRPAARRSILHTLRRMGVLIEAGVAVRAIEKKYARLADSREIAFDACVLAASFAVPELARASGLAVNDSGRLRVDEYLRALGAPGIVGAGDAIVAPDSVARHLRMSCAAALPLGGHAAGTVLAALRGEQPSRLSIGFLVHCISLGRRVGYIQLVRRDDSPRQWHLGGRPGAIIKEAVCSMVLEAPRKERTRPGSYSTLKGPVAA